MAASSGYAMLQDTINWVSSDLSLAKTAFLAGACLVTYGTASIIGPFVWKKVTAALMRKGKELPHPPAHPLLGNIPILSKELSEEWMHLDGAILRLEKRYPNLGKLWCLKLAAIDFVVVHDVEAAKEVLVTKNYAKSPTYDGLLPFIGEKSMLVAQPHVWSKQRKAFNPGFAYQHLRNTVPVFIQKTQELIKKLKKVADTGSVVLLHAEATKLTMDVIVKAALSIDLDFQADTPPAIYTSFMELLHKTATYARRPDMIFDKYLPWNWWAWRSAQRSLDNTILDIIKPRLKAAGSKGAPAGGRQDILDLAIQTAKEEGGRGLDLMDVLSQVKTFLFAGHDTTATTVGFAVYEISRNSSIEAKLVEEIDRVCGDRAPSSEDLNQFKYLTCIIKETLRMWPPGGSARIAPAGSVLQGYDVGNKVLYIPHLPAHRDPDYWGPDAHEFKPERWLDEAYVAALHPCAYMPFSKGPRDCIGQTFAMMESKTLLTLLYQHFTFRYAHDQPEDQAYQITSYPRWRVPVTVHSRHR